MKAREVRRARLVARYAEKRKRLLAEGEVATQLECYANSQSLQRHGASKRLYTSIWY